MRKQPLVGLHQKNKQVAFSARHVIFKPRARRGFRPPRGLNLHPPLGNMGNSELTLKINILYGIMSNYFVYTICLKAV
jgi:hypothetical protein